jgi:uncharacterized membrane protein YoaK (UPF0700 family)
VLVVLTLASGVLDMACYLRMGHVFMANMTGNVMFLGSSIAA